MFARKYQRGQEYVQFFLQEYTKEDKKMFSSS